MNQRLVDLLFDALSATTYALTTLETPVALDGTALRLAKFKGAALKRLGGDAVRYSEDSFLHRSAAALRRKGGAHYISKGIDKPKGSAPDLSGQTIRAILAYRTSVQLRRTR